MIYALSIGKDQTTRRYRNTGKDFMQDWNEALSVSRRRELDAPTHNAAPSFLLVIYTKRRHAEG
jgi:hypothetical protein